MKTEVEFRMLVGLPGSGKSYYSKKFLKTNPNFMYFSSDKYRKEHNLKDTSTSFFDVMYKEIRQCLKDGISVLYDATNLTSKYRKVLLALLKKVSCKKICIVMATSLDSCIRNNRSLEREHIVPDANILNFYLHFQFPQYFEGWDEIIIERPTNIEMSRTYCLEAIQKKLLNYDQNSKWHKYTLGEHMKRVGDYLKDKYNDNELALVGYIHDIGKPYVKTTDDKGESHYRYHDNVGAYESMFIKGDFNRVRVAQIIALHMNAHNAIWKETYSQLIGTSGYEILEDGFKLEEADSCAYT